MQTIEIHHLTFKTPPNTGRTVCGASPTIGDEFGVHCTNLDAPDVCPQCSKLWPRFDSDLTPPKPAGCSNTEASVSKKSESKHAPIPAIVQHALTSTIVDIVQLSKADIRTLDQYVRRGFLAKGKGGPFPNLKTVYAYPGYDFAAERQRHIDDMMQLAAMDAANRERRESTPIQPQLFGSPTTHQIRPHNPTMRFRDCFCADRSDNEQYDGQSFIVLDMKTEPDDEGIAVSYIVQFPDGEQIEVSSFAVCEWNKRERMAA